MTLSKEKFIAKIHDLTQKAKAQKNRLMLDDINDAFRDDDLTPDEYDEVFKYLENAGIDVDSSDADQKDDEIPEEPDLSDLGQDKLDRLDDLLMDDLSDDFSDEFQRSLRMKIQILTMWTFSKA